MSVSTPHQTSDPRSDLLALVERGGGATAEAVMLRLLWVRQDHPEAAVTTDVVRADDRHVVIRAQIAVPGGAAGSGIAAAQVGDGEDWAAVVERTETAAISRALDTLGYLVRHGERAGRPDHPEADSPEEVAPPQAREVREDEPETEMDEPPSQPVREAPRMVESAPPVVNALRRAGRRPEPQAGPQQAAERPAQDDAHLEEYSWSAFWGKARSLGLTPDKVTQLLGRPAPQMSPREAVEGLIEAGAWPEQGES